MTRDRALPYGWVRTNLSEVGQWGSGGTPRKGEAAYYGGDIPWLVIGDLNDGLIEGASNSITQLGLRVSSARVVPPNTLLIAMYGSIGKLGMTGLECATNQAIAFCQPHDRIDPWFVFYSLKHHRSDLISHGKGGTQQNISQTVLKAFEIAIAPGREQRRIVSKVEALQARSDAAKEALDAIPLLLKKFRQSVLAAAFRGDLTAKWRDQNPDVEPACVLLERIRAERKARFIEDTAEAARAKAQEKARAVGKPWTDADNEKVLEREREEAGKKYETSKSPDTSNGAATLPESWTLVSVADVSVCLDRLRKPITKKHRTPGPYPYYGANGLVDRVGDYIFDDELVLVTEDETFYGRKKPIAYRVNGKCWVNNHAHVLRPWHSVPADFLWQTLMHYNVLPWLSGTTGRAKLTQGALNVLPIALAPEREMKVVSAKLNKLLAFADEAERFVTEQGEPLAALTKSILAKAFRGELVPQDPNDEPANVLLERIRTERAKHAETGKTRRGKSAAASRS